MRGARRNRIDRHGGEIERLALQAFSDQNAASNFPLRGGKYSLYEGGLRVTAFVSGGLLPPAMRGTNISAPIHVCDWYVMEPVEKERVIFYGWVFFLISSGPPLVRPMGVHRTRAESQTKSS